MGTARQKPRTKAALTPHAKLAIILGNYSYTGTGNRGIQAAPASATSLNGVFGAVTRAWDAGHRVGPAVDPSLLGLVRSGQAMNLGPGRTLASLARTNPQLQPPNTPPTGPEPAHTTLKQTGPRPTAANAKDVLTVAY